MKFNTRMFNKNCAKPMLCTIAVEFIILISSLIAYHFFKNIIVIVALAFSPLILLVTISLYFKIKDVARRRVLSIKDDKLILEERELNPLFTSSMKNLYTIRFTTIENIKITKSRIQLKGEFVKYSDYFDEHKTDIIKKFSIYRCYKNEDKLLDFLKESLQ